MSITLVCTLFRRWLHDCDAKRPYATFCVGYRTPPQCVCCVFTLYRIVFWRARESYRMEFRFTHKNGDFGAISVKRREAVPRRSLEWRVTSDRCSYYTGWLFVSSSKLIWYKMIIVLLFWFRFTDSWRAKEIKMSSTLIYLTLKKTFTWLVLYY